MGDTNTRTLATYNETAMTYIERSPQEVEGFLQQWIDACFEDIPKNATVLEIGSAGGRDADYLEKELGLTNVMRSDGSSAFVENLRDHGHEAAELNILSDVIPKESVDVIFANAVMLHFDDDELQIALKNIHNGLKEGGEFYFTTAKPGGSHYRNGWSSNKTGKERFFNRIDEDDLRQNLIDAGFGGEDTTILTDPSGQWFHVASRKVSV